MNMTDHEKERVYESMISIRNAITDVELAKFHLESLPNVSSYYDILESCEKILRVTAEELFQLTRGTN